MDPSQHNSILRFALPMAIFLIVIAFRMKRLTQSRPLKYQNLWILPGIASVLTVLLLYANTPHGLDWIWIALAAMVGGALGWLRGMTIKLSYEPETNQIMAQGSALAIVFLLALVAIRFGLRGLLLSQSSALGISTALIDGAFLAMACGLLCARAIEMGVRARGLIIRAAAPEPVI